MTNDIHDIPQFFTVDAKGDAQAAYSELLDGYEITKESRITPRVNNRHEKTPAVRAIGVPGIPFERGEPNPDVFYQGEDIVYDLYLYFDGAPVSVADYDIMVMVKASPRAFTVVWEGKLDSGVYPIQNAPGLFEVWIPSSATEQLRAGTYHIDVQLVESLARGKGRHDRKHVLLQHVFNIDYSTFSTKPETRSALGEKLTREGVEATWPNSPDTVGKFIGGEGQSSGMPSKM
jgi:hypothetical protein